MMRTLVLVGIAATVAWWSDAAQSTTTNHEETRVERRVIVVHPEGPEDSVVYQGRDDRVLTEAEYRGRWQGQWTGTWEDADGRRYNGTYDGTYDATAGADRGTAEALSSRETSIRRESSHESRGASYGEREIGQRRGPVHHDEELSRAERAERYGADRYEGRSDERRYDDREMERLCRRDNGLGGAAIGAVVGGLAGNRVAGRGNRTEGTLLGAGVGAIAGAVIDRSEDNRACDAYWARTERRGGYRAAGGGYGDEYRYGSYESGYTTTYGGGYEGGGGTTTIVIPGQPIIIEETETTYETVTVAATQRARTAPRRAVHRRRAPARPRCTCR